MDKEIYFKLSDNADLNELHLQNMQQVTEHILNDIGDMHPNEVEQLQYTITPVLMTPDEFAFFNTLPP